MALRERLQEITRALETAQHEPLLRRLSAEIPNTVVIVERADPELDFNCVMFALDLVGWIEPPTSPLGRYYASTEFLGHLIESGQLMQAQEPTVGDVVVYSQDGRITHVGKCVREGRVRSKWGSGHVYEHGTWEVPHSYGTTVRYFSALDGEAAQKYLEQFLGNGGR